MASELISRDRTIEHMKSMAGCDACNNYAGVRCRACAWDDAMNIVNDLPAIDAIPVEWLKQQFYDNPNSQWAEKCRDVFTGWQKWQRLQKEQEAQDG